MSNAKEATASREEEIAFLVMEQVLGVDIRLADAGAGNSKPDGAWFYPRELGRCGIVEVTSPPSSDLMASWAQAKKAGQPQRESGSIHPHLNKLAQVVTDMLNEKWAVENVDKLIANEANERHLFLFARSYGQADYFYRLSDSCDDSSEQVDDIVLPNGITDVWFLGRAKWNKSSCATDQWVARFQDGSGWHRHTARIQERRLPPPNPSIANDQFDRSERAPKDRTG